MSEIKFNEALNLVKQFGNFFKAFKQLEEMIEQAVLIEQNRAELKKQRDKLASEIELLQEKKKEEEVSYNALVNELEKAETEAKDKFQADIKSLRERLEIHKESVNKEIEALNALKEKAYIKHAEMMGKMKEEADGLQRLLEKTKADIEEIKNKLN